MKDPDYFPDVPEIDFFELALARIEKINPILENQIDDVSIFSSRELFSINDISLIWANINPIRNTSIDCAWRAQTYSQKQIDIACAVRETVLDGLIVGTLAPFALWINNIQGIKEIAQTDLISSDRENIILEKTLIKSNVLSIWLRQKNIQTAQEVHKKHDLLIAQTDTTPQTQEPKELSTRERGTYQNIIKSLLHELKRLGVDEKAFANIITQNSALVGEPVPQSTVYKKLDELKK